VLGFLLGWRRKKPAHGKRSYLGLAALAIIGFPVGTLLLAKLFGSDVLGWLFGLTLIFGLPLVLLLGVGVLAGSFFNRARDEGGNRESAVQPAVDDGWDATRDRPSNEAAMAMGPHDPKTVLRSTVAPRLPASANRGSRSLEASDLVTCHHLSPVEHAMRLEGLKMRMENASRLNVTCRIDLTRLSAEFGPAVASLYVERHEIDRSYLDPKSALFWCVACQCRLAVVHPEEAGEATPWFPREPSQSD
jgi:hypothetical protein